MKSSASDNRCRTVRSAVRLALAASALSSMAIPYVQAADENELEEIVVTGSRIIQPNLDSISPITSLTADDIKNEGVSRVEDLLNRLPQVFAGQASTISNAADGTASVDLRGLGPSRTLVLINGRRLMPGDPSNVQGDINAIPASLVKRVEVMTGGASATYGADAVSGVVNFIMDNNFTGFKLDGQYSTYQHHNDSDLTPSLLAAQGYPSPDKNVADGGAWDLTASMGTGFADGAGHMTAYLGYRTINAVTQNNRDYSACTLQNASATTLKCGGSATAFPASVILYDGGTSTYYSPGPGGSFVNAPNNFNYAPTNYYQRPDTRYSGGMFVDYEMSDSIKPYMEMMFMDDRSIAQLAPSGDFGNTLTINCDNPLMSVAQRAVICDGENLVNGFLGTFPLTDVTNAGAAPINFINTTGGAAYNRGFFQPLRRNVEGGPRQDDLQHTSFRTVLGLKGELNPVWSYDAYYQFGRTNFSESYYNEFSVARLTRALDVVTDSRAGSATLGQPVCRSVVDGSDPLCVPYNILGSDPVSQAAVKYVSATAFQRGNIDQRTFSAALTGDMAKYGIKTPWSDLGLGVALGGETTKTAGRLNTDQEYQTADLTGQGSPTLPVSGQIKVKELFTEAQLPLITGGVVEDLTFNAGYRYSDYSTAGAGVSDSFRTNAWKVGFELAPIHDIRLRGGINRAVRAPNIVELYAPLFVGLDGSTDPCAGKTITAADVGCIAQGVALGTKTSKNPAEQYNGLQGGNPSLKPEKATTKTIGVILQPSLLPSSSFTVDYYDIDLHDAIQGFGADAIVGACTGSATPLTDPACALIHRNPVTGSLWLTPDGYITDLSSNVGGVHTKGVDFSADYSYDLGSIGKLSADMIGTLITDYTVDNGISAAYDCTGLYGATCSGLTTTPTAPIAKWRHNLRVSLQMPNGIGTSLQWRYFGSVKSDAEVTGGDPVGPFDAKIGSVSYLDLSAWYKLSKMYSFHFGINNLLDRAPPMVTSGSGGFANPCPTGPCNGNTYPAVYDALGRYIFGSVSISL